MLKKIAIPLLFLGIFLVSGCGQSVLKVTNSYVGPISTNEEAFYNAVFPLEGATESSVSEIGQYYEALKGSYDRMESYLTESTDDIMATPEWQKFHDYFVKSYQPVVKPYIEYAGNFVADLQAGQDTSSYLDTLVQYDSDFIDAHNGFVEILK